METLLGVLAFTAFILAQVAAVVAVHAEASVANRTRSMRADHFRRRLQEL